MDSSLSTVVTRSGESQYCHAPVYTGVDEQYDNNHSNNKGGQTDRGLRISNKNVVWKQCRAFWKYYSDRYNILRKRRSQTLDTGDYNKSCWNSRKDKYNHRLDCKYYYYILIGLLTISPVYANEPEVNNTSNPVAAATGNVTNQAVQFQNNGASSRQQYAGGNTCNGSTMTFSPFYMGNHAKPWSEKEGESGLHPSSYQLNENWGFQVNFMVPLSKQSFKQCLEIAKRHEEKMRLEYELTRAIKCAELGQKGYTLLPGSRVYEMCSDVVPIKSLLPKEENVSTTKTNYFNFFKKP